MDAAVLVEGEEVVCVLVAKDVAASIHVLERLGVVGKKRGGDHTFYSGGDGCRMKSA